MATLYNDEKKYGGNVIFHKKLVLFKKQYLVTKLIKK